MIKKAKRTYFLMTNQKGDYGCFFFEDYELYKQKWTLILKNLKILMI